MNSNMSQPHELYKSDNDSEVASIPVAIGVSAADAKVTDVTGLPITLGSHLPSSQIAFSILANVPFF